MYKFGHEDEIELHAQRKHREEEKKKTRKYLCWTLEGDIPAVVEAENLDIAKEYYSSHQRINYNFVLADPLDNILSSKLVEKTQIVKVKNDDTKINHR